MDAQFMNDLLKGNDAEELLELIGALKGSITLDEVMADMAKWVKDIALPTYEVGRAQQRRAEAATRLEAALQDLWERQLIAALRPHAGPAFDKLVLEVARTKFVEEIPGGTVVKWRGLCVTNVGTQPLTNVTLALKLNAGPDLRSAARSSSRPSSHARPTSCT